jgi:hypothetical protein
MKIIYILSVLIITCSSCGSNKADAPITDNDSLAENVPFSWEATINDSTQRLEMIKKEGLGPDTLTTLSVINFINTGNPVIKLELVKISGDTVYAKIQEAEYLTQRMGSTGPTMYLAAAVYNLTELPGIRFVNFDFEEGDHAQPGTFNRDSFKND